MANNLMRQYRSIAKLAILTAGFITSLWIINLILTDNVIQYCIDMVFLIIFLSLESFWANARYSTTEKNSN